MFCNDSIGSAGAPSNGFESPAISRFAMGHSLFLCEVSWRTSG